MRKRPGKVRTFSGHTASWTRSCNTNSVLHTSSPAGSSRVTQQTDRGTTGKATSENRLLGEADFPGPFRKSANLGVVLDATLEGTLVHARGHCCCTREGQSPASSLGRSRPLNLLLTRTFAHFPPPFPSALQPHWPSRLPSTPHACLPWAFRKCTPRSLDSSFPLHSCPSSSCLPPA